MNKKTLTTIMLAFALIILVQGCNTMKGAGEDIQDAGDAVEDAAE
jgi:predicted small secreted protein